MFDKFLGKEQLQLNKSENSSWQVETLAEHFAYTKGEAEFAEFANWLANILNDKIFLDKVNEFIEIEQQLKNEPVGQKRSELVEKFSNIKYG